MLQKKVERKGFMVSGGFTCEQTPHPNLSNFKASNDGKKSLEQHF